MNDKKKLIGVVSPPYDNARKTTQEYDDKYDLRRPKGIAWGRESFRGRYSENKNNIGNLISKEEDNDDFDIAKFHDANCGDSLYWHGCYGSDTAWKKYVTPESYAHPAKASFLLMDRIFKHLIKLGLLNQDDVVTDFMCGTSRTGIVASLHGFDYVGIELEKHFIDMSKNNLRKLIKEGQFCRCDIE